MLSLLGMLVAGAMWQATLHDGTVLRGEPRGWTVQSLTLVDGDNAHELALTDVRRVEPTEPARPADRSNSSLVILKDGSRVFADNLTLAEGQLTLQLDGQSTITLPGDQMTSVRFSPRPAAQDAQWNELAQQVRDTDAVVIIRPTGSLDHASGIVSEIQPDAVKFEFGEETIALPRQRLAGVLLVVAAANTAPRAAVVVELNRGDIWQVAEIDADGERLRAKTLSGADLEWRWDEVRGIVPQVASFEYLSNLEPLEQSWQPYLAANPAEAADLALLFQPQRDRSFLSAKLAVRAAEGYGRWQEFDRGVAIHSRSELTYRLGGRYRRLTATVGIDPRVSRPGHVMLTILADGNPVFEGAIDGQEPGRMLDVDVKSASRLKIIVDYGERLDAGDHLNLCDAKLWE